jgi:YVTN family beta-propeller protein
VGSPDVSDIVLDKESKFAWLAVSGRDVLTRVTVHDRRRDAIWPISQRETLVGANPRGLALSPDGKHVWVANTLGNSVTVVDAQTMQVLSTIDLGAASRVDPSIDGQYLFNNAGMTEDHRFTCASCHPDGASDGLTWSFVHVKDGMNRRNSRDLRAGIAKTAPFRWSGFDAHLPEFVESEVTGLLRGPKPTSAQTAALLRAIDAMSLPPNPYRTPEGELTEQAKRGEALFTGKGGCVSCHSGALSGGTGAKEWAGTTAAGQMLDVPHLRGVYDSAPYLHDGRAATLEEVFDKHNARGRHGNAAALTAEELADLLRYAREL